MNDDEAELVFSTLQRHEATIQSMRVLAVALIATHHNHSELLEKLLAGMDVVADSVEPESLPLYRKELQFFQSLILDHVNGKS